MEHKRDLCEMIPCREAQAVHHEYQKSFLRMRDLKPLVDKARAAHSRNELSEGRLKRILLAFADAQTEYTNVSIEGDSARQWFPPNSSFFFKP